MGLHGSHGSHSLHRSHGSQGLHSLHKYQGSQGSPQVPTGPHRSPQYLQVPSTSQMRYFCVIANSFQWVLLVRLNQPHKEATKHFFVQMNPILHGFWGLKEIKLCIICAVVKYSNNVFKVAKHHVSGIRGSKNHVSGEQTQFFPSQLKKLSPSLNKNACCCINESSRPGHCMTIGSEGLGGWAGVAGRIPPPIWLIH